MTAIAAVRRLVANGASCVIGLEAFNEYEPVRSSKGANSVLKNGRVEEAVFFSELDSCFSAVIERSKGYRHTNNLWPREKKIELT